jgi:hypothetical protein
MLSAAKQQIFTARYSNSMQRGQTELFNIPNFNPSSCKWLQYVKCIGGETLSTYGVAKGDEIVVCGVCRGCDETRGQSWGDLEYSRMARRDKIKAEVLHSSEAVYLKWGGGCMFQTEHPSH